jgi:hypothetical protein
MSLHDWCQLEVICISSETRNAARGKADETKKLKMLVVVATKRFSSLIAAHDDMVNETWRKDPGTADSHAYLDLQVKAYGKGSPDRFLSFSICLSCAHITH